MINRYRIIEVVILQIVELRENNKSTDFGLEFGSISVILSISKRSFEDNIVFLENC